MPTSPSLLQNTHGRPQRARRWAWSACYALLFRPTPWFMRAWRVWLLRRFGARAGPGHFDPTTKIWAPWRLEAGRDGAIDQNVNLYNVFGIKLGNRVIISRGAFLCSSATSYHDPSHVLTGARIIVEDDCWIAAEAFIGPGVTIGKGAVVGARGVVVKDVPPWTVVAGNPARVIGDRVLGETTGHGQPEAAHGDQLMRTTPLRFHNPHSRRQRAGRLAWGLCHAFLFRPTPGFMGAWRSWLLRRFGARTGLARFKPTAEIWAPWRLETGSEVYIDHKVNLYNVFGIKLGDRVIISQGAFLCSATHDYRDPSFALIGRCITLEDDCWIAAEAFIGPGVSIGQGAVVGARAVVVKDVAAWTVVAGNPARVIGKRVLGEVPRVSIPNP